MIKNIIGAAAAAVMLTARQFTVPKEFQSLRDDRGNICGFVEMLPGELYERLGLKLLTNDNFTETKSAQRSRSVSYGEKHTWEPMICFFGANDDHPLIEYVLYDKNIAENVWFSVSYSADNDNSDGLSDLVVSDDTASFVLDGARYHLTFDDSDNADMRQVLADLGVL